MGSEFKWQDAARDDIMRYALKRCRLWPLHLPITAPTPTARFLVAGLEIESS